MSGDSFEARALQLAFDLTTPNTYEGKVGQGYNEARAHDIRRLYNVLCGRDAEEHGHGPAKKGEVRRRKKGEDPMPALPDAGALGRS